MPDAATSPTAVEWASTMSRRSFREKRAELDALVVATVPNYQVAVDRRLEAFAAGVEEFRREYDIEHSAARFTRPWRLRRLQRVLFWVFLLGILISFGLMFPVGGRSVGAADFGLVDWGLFVMLSAISFVIGVLAQLARRLPVVPGIPPRKDLAWLPTGFGVPTVAMMIVNYNFERGVQPGWIVLTSLALLVSFAYCVTRAVQRGRNPNLTRLVDTSERARVLATRESLKARADDCADLIESDFNALPAKDRRRLLDEYEAAARELRRRGVNPGTRPHATRPAIPGYLLLERRAHELWDPNHPESEMVMPLNWRPPNAFL
jgi:hypothetical protein